MATWRTHYKIKANSLPTWHTDYSADENDFVDLYHIYETLINYGCEMKQFKNFSFKDASTKVTRNLVYLPLLTNTADKLYPMLEHKIDTGLVNDEDGEKIELGHLACLTGTVPKINSTKAFALYKVLPAEGIVYISRTNTELSFWRFGTDGGKQTLKAYTRNDFVDEAIPLQLFVILQAGGGGGGASGGVYDGTGGGGGGAAIAIVSFRNITTWAVSAGPGGAGGTEDHTTGKDGGNSQLYSVSYGNQRITAFGGSPGFREDESETGGKGGSWSARSIEAADVVLLKGIYGGDGAEDAAGHGVASTVTTWFNDLFSYYTTYRTGGKQTSSGGGGGGASAFGDGGDSGGDWSPGSDGTSGSGGGGGRFVMFGSRDGGAGGDGFVLLYANKKIV